jgi:hypothetical protein
MANNSGRASGFLSKTANWRHRLTSGIRAGDRESAPLSDDPEALGEATIRGTTPGRHSAPAVDAGSRASGAIASDLTLLYTAPAVAAR